MADAELFRDDPRDYALKMVEDEQVSSETMLIALLKYMSHDDVRGALEANDLEPENDPDEELAEELEENGLDEVAENLREHGREATLEWVDDKIEEVKAGRDPFDPDGSSLHNLEVARDRLAE